MSRVTVGLVIVMLSRGGAGGHAQTRDVGAMITEIKPGRGRIEVSGPGTADWRPAGPLLALKVGDSLRATDNASAVVVLAGRRGSVQVDAARSPFVVTAPPAESKAQKAFLLARERTGLPRQQLARDAAAGALHAERGPTAGDPEPARGAGHAGRARVRVAGLPVRALHAARGRGLRPSCWSAPG